MSNLALVYATQNELEKALGYCERAAAILEWIAPASIDLARCITRLGAVHKELGNLSSAITALTRAVILSESLRSRAGAGEAKERVFAAQQSPFQLLIACLQDRGEPGDFEEAFSLAERSRARALVELLAERQVPIRAETAEQAEVLDEERALQARLAATYRRLVEARQDQGAPADLAVSLEAEERELSQQLESVRDRLRSVFPAYADLEYPEPLDLEATQELLGETTLLLEFDATGGDCFVWAVRKQGFAMKRIDAGGERIGDLVEQAVGAYQHGQAERPVAGAARAELSELLLGPLPAELWEGVERLIVVPDGLLHYLPFELLPAPGSDEPLFERYPLSYAPSATALRSLDRFWKKGDGSQFVGFGDPEFSNGGGGDGEEPSRSAANRFAVRGVPLAPLPQSGKEVKAIAKGFGAEASAYVRGKATERRARLESRGARFVHFATHGLLDDERPLYSALALSQPTKAELAEDPSLDELLEVHEMFSLELGAEAVVLSACQTGLGKISDGEGMVGMTRALFFAGARCVLVSLWPVDDEATSELMQSFYRRIREGGAVVEALRGAKAELREAGRPASQWAGFVAVGVGW